MHREDAPPKTVELWIRSFTPKATGPHYERALERLENLAACPEIGSATAAVWGKEVEQTDERSPVAELRAIQRRLEAVESWASETGREIEPFFRSRRVESTITDERYEVWRPPSLAVLEFRGDELVHVAPSRKRDRIVDPVERLEDLDRGDAVDPVLTFDGDDAVSETTRSSTSVDDDRLERRGRGTRSVSNHPGFD